MKSDHALRQDVLDELAWEPSVNDTAIGVEVEDGVVTLTGHLGSYSEKKAAERAVERVAGVRAIAEEIDVRLPMSSKRTDADIARTAMQALEWSSAIPAGQVHLKVESGWITLTGELEHEYQRAEAEQAVRGLMGLVGVSNQITLKPAILSKDVKVKIEAALQRRAHMDTQAINVTVDGDQIVLSGTIRSLGERAAALEAAHDAPGISRVIDHMRIV